MKLFTLHSRAFNYPATSSPGRWSAPAGSPTEKTLKTPNWLPLLLLLSFFSLQLQAQDLQTVDKYTEAGLALPTVTSDKDDYAPGEIAYITGSGWTLDSMVDIHFEEEPSHDHHHGYHDTKVNADGTWLIEYPIEERHLGTKFTVVVDGVQSHYQGLAYFTDALNTKLTVDPSTGNQGEAVTLTAKLVQDADGRNATLGVGNENGIQGMTVNFSLRTISVGSAVTDAYGVATLITTIPSTIAPGTYSDGIYAEYLKPNRGIYNSSNGTATLTVNSAQAITSFTNLSSPTATYGTTSTTLSGVISSNNGVPTGSVSITLNGVTESAIIGSTGAFSSSFATGSLAVGSSPYTITYSYDGNSSFFAISDATKSLTVTKAPATVTLTDLSPTYNGSAKAASASTTATGASSFTYTYTKVGASVNAADVVNAGSYSVTATLVNDNFSGSATGTLVIAQKPLTVVVDAKAKVYGTDNPTLTGTFSGAVNSDGITVSYATTATQTCDVVAGGYPITATLADPNSKLDNYSVTNTPAVLTITQAPATITVTDLAKTYNGSAQGATVTTAPEGLAVTVTYAPVVGGVTGTASATVPTAAGTYAVVAALNNSNYSAGNGTGTLVIAQKAITGSFTVPASKVYDGGATASVLTRSLNDVIGSDAVTLSGGTASFSDKNVGTGKTVTLTGAALAGADAGNYSLSSVGTTTANITAKAITGSFTASNKMYDGNTDATVLTRSLSGVLGSDVVSLTGGTATFADINPGLNKVVTLTDASISGANADNYSLASVGTTTANIYAAPVVTLTISDPVQINSTSVATATLGGDVFSKEWKIVSPSGEVTTIQVADNLTNPPTQISHSITSSIVGVYTVSLSYKNGMGREFTAGPAYAVFFDPSAGFVTGGGWIESPAGAMPGNPGAFGKANFGFVSKYVKGANVPTGNTEFQFKAGDLNFKSTNYQWLTVSGSRAQFKGTGTINGLGSYDFILTAIDGQVTGGGGVDRFRIKITHGTTVVYDNQMGDGDDAIITTAITGSIVIHTPTKGTKAVRDTTEALEVLTAPETAQFFNYPNTFTERTTIAFVIAKDEAYSLEVYDLRGGLVKKVATGTAEAGTRYEHELDASSLASGMYFARLTTASGVQMIRMVRK